MEILHKEADQTVKRLSHRILELSQKGDIDGLRDSVRSEIMPKIAAINAISAAGNEESESARKSILSQLLANNVKDPGNYEATPLHLACFWGHLAVAKYLVEECGSDLMARVSTNEGEMPIHCASGKGHVEVVKWLSDGWPDLVLEANRFDGATPLHMAALDNRLEVMKYLVLEKRVNVDAVDSKFGRTPLIMAAQNGHLNAVKFLVEECKASLDIQDQFEDGWFVIHLAAHVDQVAVVEYLMQRRPDFLELQNKKGLTPLQVAKARRNSKVVKFLLSKGATEPHNGLLYNLGKLFKP